MTFFAANDDLVARAAPAPRLLLRIFVFRVPRILEFVGECEGRESCLGGNAPMSMPSLTRPDPLIYN